MKKLIHILSGIIVLSIVGFVAYVSAEETNPIPPDVKMALTMNSDVYSPDDNSIQATLTISNESSQEIITSKGFSETEFYLFLRFYDEAGNIISSDLLTEYNALAPGPPRIFPDSLGAMIQGELVEILPAGWFVSFQGFNVNDYYPIENISGSFSVKAVAAMRTYPGFETAYSSDGVEIKYAPLDSYDKEKNVSIESNVVNFTKIADSDGDYYYYPEPWGENEEPDCNDNNADVHPNRSEIPANGIDDDCDPGTVDAVAENYGFLDLKACRHTVGTGSHPGSVKEPMGGLTVRVYDKSQGSFVSGIGVSWKNYQTIWDDCPSPAATGATNGDGIVKLPLPPGNYLVIARHDPSDNDGDEIYLGVSVGAIDPGVTVEKFLQMIVKADGKKSPAKYTRRTGSDLLIIEPEYVEWDGTQELYPFIFDSVGDWVVTTSVAPPEGFVADNDNLSEEVISEVEAVQFMITDIGSKWVSTGVVHTVKHKNKTEKIKSKIGIKLTKKLAKKKGLGIYGDEGKKSNQKDKKEK